jgi:hypothetical protein
MDRRAGPDNRERCIKDEDVPLHGTQATFVVPAGVTTIKIVALGASGGHSTGGTGTGGGVGGEGGRVKATIPVTPDESLAVFVEGQGGTSSAFNGGAPGGRTSGSGHRRRR